MDVLKIMIFEHERIAGLFVQIKAERQSRRRKALFDALRRRLTLHLHAVETIFYPALIEDPDCKSLVEECQAQDEDLLTLLRQIAAADQSSITFENKMVELMNHFDHHVSWLETEVFTRVKQVKSRNQRIILGRDYLSMTVERDQAA
jgi:hypothetical protein